MQMYRPDKFEVKINGVEFKPSVTERYSHPFYVQGSVQTKGDDLFYLYWLENVYFNYLLETLYGTG